MNRQEKPFSINIPQVSHTSAVTSIWSQNKSWFTDAFKTSIFIYAHPIQAHVCCGTLIVVCKTFQWKLLLVSHPPEDNTVKIIRTGVPYYLTRRLVSNYNSDKVSQEFSLHRKISNFFFMLWSVAVHISAECVWKNRVYLSFIQERIKVSIAWEN